MLSFLLNCKRIYNDFIKDEVTVYAAQASFFIVLSAAPFIMILLTLIQLIPAVSPEDLMHVMTQLLPSSIHPLIESVIQDIQTVSPAALLSGYHRGNHLVGCPRHAWDRPRLKPDHRLPQAQKLPFRTYHQLWLYHRFSPDVHFLPGSDSVRFLPAAPAIPLLSDAGQIRFLPD